jgi:long-chain acyl-CoA synthetase
MSHAPDKPALFYPDNGRFLPLTNRAAQQIATEIGLGLWQLGLRQGDRVAIMSDTRYEWDLVDSGALALGFVVVAIYPTTTADHTTYILQHSEAKTAVLENADHWQKVAPHLSEMPNLAHIVLINPAGAPPGDWISLDQLRDMGRKLLLEQPNLADEAREAVQPDDLAGLVYTSGTTGLPKGVALTHNNLFSVAEALTNMVPMGNGDTSVIYLPMAHILQRVNIYYGRMAGIVGYYAPAVTELIATCQAAQPRSIAGVPRVFEKIHTGIMAKVAQSPPKRQIMFHRAIAVGKQRARLLLAERPLPLTLRLQYNLYERLIFRKLRGAIFGERIEFMASGAAPISTELLEFFYAIGLPIYEGYGLTETSSPITLNGIGRHKIGTVGPPLADAEVKIAADGEILLRGPGVFTSYYKDPEASAAAFTEDGWFKSGDIGELDADGYLRITDRKKNLLITAAGKNIAPAPIENQLLQHPLIGQVVVHGDRRKYLVALFTLDEEMAPIWAAQNGKADKEIPDLADDPDVLQAIEGFVNEVNAGLAQYETIKYFRICPEPFSVENGALTPTLKLKRRVVEERFGALLDEMYV